MMKDMHRRLIEVTHDCRPDMHESDEQGITAILTGFQLDNAMGDNPHRNLGEMTIGIKREDRPHDIEWFNIASLIALARIAKFPGDQ